MELSEIGSFQAFHRSLPWPWVAVDARRTRFAFAASDRSIATCVLDAGVVKPGPTFSLPLDLSLPTQAAGDATPPGLRAFAVDGGGEMLALVGTVGEASVVVSLGANGELVRSTAATLLGPGFVAQATAFDRSGTRIWVSADNGTETALALPDSRTHAVHGVVRSAPLPPPAFHELHVHPVDDAVLLLAACGQEGTFARVAGFTDGAPLSVATQLAAGSVPSGFVGFSSDAARVHLVEADELRTHAWPGLEELSAVELSDDFVSSYAGVVLGHRIFVDGHDGDDESDAVMLFDRSAIRGARVRPPVPRGMWVGRLGPDALITVEAKGEPALVRVVRLPELQN